MSADEYHECPICKGIPEKYRKYKELYGKIPLETFLKLKNTAISNSNCVSVGIYNEVTLHEDGTIDVQIGAECSVCKAHWDYDVKNVTTEMMK